MGENNGHNFRIFLASFLTIFAAGVGFGVRTRALDVWGELYGFTKSELGDITGGGLWGFGIVIILGSLFLDKIGYKPILILAFLLHAASAALTLSAQSVFESSGPRAAYDCLWYGMVLFAVGNGLCEAAVNPLVATLYPRAKTHYLNILHASWPAGLVIGSLLGYAFLETSDTVANVAKLDWRLPMGMFLVPVFIYGLLILLEKLPVSEANKAGVSVGEMLLNFASPMLLMLLLLHAMVGYVELGTDSWITSIMNNVVKEKAMLLFIYTSLLMFVLRFFAGPIVERINPLGLLTLSAILGFVGLQMLSKADAVGYAFLAGTVYGLGKTFLWPTMLGVVGERFPRGGAIVMGAMGGIGMLSAGLLGGPAIGYKQDKFASEYLQEKSPEGFARYKSDKSNDLYHLLPPITGLDGAKVAVISDKGKTLAADLEKVEKSGSQSEGSKAIRDLAAWWTTAETTAEADGPLVNAARLHGGREALRLTSFVPAAMAVLYLLIVLYFRATGGYKQIHVSGEPVGPSEY